MIDMKDILPTLCDECGEINGLDVLKLIHRIEGHDALFCTLECAQQFVNNYNADYAERKADEKKYEGPE